MNDLKFDLYALVKPKTKADVAALAEEALNELENINEHLDSILKSINLNDFKPARDMLIKYFNVEVPLTVLKTLCLKEHFLFKEIVDQSVTDTYAREMFIDAVLNYYCLSCWPSFSHPDEYQEKFFSALDKVAPKNTFGINVFE